MPTTCDAAGSACGTTDDGCGGTIDCGMCPEGTNCVDHLCECSPGVGEPNESPTAAISLGEFRDSDDREEIYALYAITSDSDEDWYELTVVDACCLSNPSIHVELSGIPSGSNYDLGLWYDCDSGGGPGTCADGTPDTAMGGGCLSTNSSNMPETVQLDTSCGGINENGTAFIRVRAASWAATCGVYRLTIRVT